MPDSANLEYYLGNSAATPRGTPPAPAFTNLSPMPPLPPQNTFAGPSAELPQLAHQPPWSAHQHFSPEGSYVTPYGGLEERQPSTSALPEFEPQKVYTYPKPRPILTPARASIPSSRPQLQPSPALANPEPVSQAAATDLPPVQAPTGPSSSPRTCEPHSYPVVAASSSRQARRSTVSSDGASSHSSMWRAWEHSNRSWVNEGFETPSDVQDVQLGSSAAGVGGGNSYSIAGYFSWR